MSAYDNIMTDDNDEAVYKIIEPTDRLSNSDIIREMIKQEFLLEIHSSDGTTFSLNDITGVEEQLLKTLLRRSKKYLEKNDRLISQIQSVIKRIENICEINYPSPDTLWTAIKEDVPSGIVLLMQCVRNVVYELSYKMGCNEYEMFNKSCLFLKNNNVLDTSDLESILLLMDYGDTACTMIDVNTPNIDYMIEWKSIYVDLVLTLFNLS